MSLFCQTMLDIGATIAASDPVFDDLSVKFGEHFLWIAHAMNQVGEGGMWDEEDGFYYDVLRRPDGTATRLKVRSMVGLLPLCATTVFEPSERRAGAAARRPPPGAGAALPRPAGQHPRAGKRRLGAGEEEFAYGERAHPRGREDRTACAASSRACSTRASS